MAVYFDFSKSNVDYLNNLFFINSIVSPADSSAYKSTKKVVIDTPTDNPVTVTYGYPITEATYNHLVPGSNFAWDFSASYKIFFSRSIPLFPKVDSYVKSFYTDWDDYSNDVSRYGEAANFWHTAVYSLPIARIEVQENGGIVTFSPSVTLSTLPLSDDDDWTQPVTAIGSKGSDFFYGSEDSDTLYGEEGDDSLNPNKGSDLVNGGAGWDILNFLYSEIGEFQAIRSAIAPTKDYQFQTTLKFGASTATLIRKGDDRFIINSVSEGNDTAINIEQIAFVTGVDAYVLPATAITVEIERKANGSATCYVTANGEKVPGLSAKSVAWDTALPLPEGEYGAYYRYSEKNGRTIELYNSAGGNVVHDGVLKDGMQIHRGSAKNGVGLSEGCFVTGLSKDFQNKLFSFVEKDINDPFVAPQAEFALDAARPHYYPVVPVIVRINDAEPVLQPKVVGVDPKRAASDAKDNRISVQFKVNGDGKGLADKKIKIFFTATGDRASELAAGVAVKGKKGDKENDWDFAGKNVKPAGKTKEDGDQIYSVLIDANKKNINLGEVTIKIDLFKNESKEGIEKISLNILEFDIERYRPTKDPKKKKPWVPYEDSYDIDTDGYPKQAGYVTQSDYLLLSSSPEQRDIDLTIKADATKMDTLLAI